MNILEALMKAIRSRASHNPEAQDAPVSGV